MLQRMADIMRYRGPDSDGFHLDEGIGLGVRRLSIIDTAGGDQPIANEDGSVVVVCNGEIYNYVELRERLEGSGHRFRTHSDVEVIVHLYEDDPDEFLHELRGMFGLALWDARRHRLLLARDRLGIKPLHYALAGDGLVFGSELKTVLASGLVAPARDAVALKDLLTFGFVRAPRTMLAGVQRLLPGQWLRFAAGEMAKGFYWDASFPQRQDYDSRRTAAEWSDALREKLRESVRIHLRSDVPVGAWLSGGIDSSAVTALMRREMSDPIHTFTLAFENPDVDEVSGNRLLDDYPEYNLVGRRIECRRQHFELLPRAVWHREQPFGMGVDISRMLLAHATAQQLKVVLTGEGSDEVLGGYSWYRANKILAPFSALPAWIRGIGAQLLSATGRWPGAARILESPPGMNRRRFCALTGGPESLQLQRSLVAEELAQAMDATDTEDDLMQQPEAFHTWHPFAQLQYVDIKLRLANSVIPHLDLFSMAHSVEARVPFLDHSFVEFCALIPPSIKMRGWEEKAVLRRAMHGILPAEVCRRKKFGLSAPTRDWMAAALPEFAATTLSPKQLQDRGWFHPAAVMRLLTEHRSGGVDHSRLLMMILTTQLWDEMFLKQFSAVNVTGVTHALSVE